MAGGARSWLRGGDALSVPPYSPFDSFFFFLVKIRSTVCISGPLPPKKRLFGQNMSSVLLKHKDQGGAEEFVKRMRMYKTLCVHPAREGMYFLMVEFQSAFNQAKLESLKTGFPIHVLHVSYINTCTGDVYIDCYYSFPFC